MTADLMSLSSTNSNLSSRRVWLNLLTKKTKNNMKQNTMKSRTKSEESKLILVTKREISNQTKTIMTDSSVRTNPGRLTFYSRQERQISLLSKQRKTNCTPLLRKIRPTLNHRLLFLTISCTQLMTQLSLRRSRLNWTNSLQKLLIWR